MSNGNCGMGGVVRDGVQQSWDKREKTINHNALAVDYGQKEFYKSKRRDVCLSEYIDESLLYRSWRQVEVSEPLVRNHVRCWPVLGMVTLDLILDVGASVETAADARSAPEKKVKD